MQPLQRHETVLPGFVGRRGEQRWSRLRLEELHGIFFMTQMQRAPHPMLSFTSVP